MCLRINPVELTAELVSIPSFVDTNHDEANVAESICEHLHKIPYLSITKQKVSGDRFNIIASTPGVSKLLLAGHMDTVQPKDGWTHNQFNGQIDNGRLYGIGALDMKGGMASIISAMSRVDNARGLTALFYCDEEYDFSGMRKFISKNKAQLGDIAVIAEDSNEGIWNKHRGLIEVAVEVRGKTGHAAKPDAGANAIWYLVKSVMEISEILECDFREPELGAPTINIAFIRGGLFLGYDDDGSVTVGKEGNNISDYYQAVIEVRPTTSNLDSQMVLLLIEDKLKAYSCQLAASTTRHNLGSLNTSRASLFYLEESVKHVTGSIGYCDPSTKGYGDGQMLYQKFGIPTANFGPKGENAHAPDEWVSVDSLEVTTSVYENLITRMCCH